MAATSANIAIPTDAREKRNFVANRLANGEYSGPTRDKAIEYVNRADRYLAFCAQKQQGSQLVQKGIGLILIGLAVTAISFMLAPGGFFIMTWGLVLSGIIALVRGIKLQSRSGKALKALNFE